jgi:hypothetical protein
MEVMKIILINLLNGILVWYIYNLRTSKSDELVNFLLMRGIGTEVHYPVSPCNQVAFKCFFEGKNFPTAKRIHIGR